MRTLFLFLVAAILGYGCEEEDKSSAEKEIRRLKTELEEKRKEISDKKELARLEEELNRLDDELRKVGGVSTTEDGISKQKRVESTSPAPGTATIKGSSVNMRATPSVQSARISSFSNGEVVTILETQQSNKTNEAILTKEVPLYASATQTGQALFTLPKGKAVVIEGYEEGTTKINVSYQHPQKGKLYAQIDEAFIESIENGAWYKVKRNNGQTGWVYEQFIKIN